MFNKYCKLPELCQAFIRILRPGSGIKGEALVTSNPRGFFTNATKACKVPLSTILRSPVSAPTAPALYIFEFHIYFDLEQWFANLLLGMAHFPAA